MKFKRAVSLIIALVMVCSVMLVPVSAKEATGVVSTMFDICADNVVIKNVNVKNNGYNAVYDANIVILNPVSQIIWGKLENGADFNEILNAVTAEFDVSDEEATDDIKEFLNGLEEAKLLK